jgi:hypothetical protein
MQRKIEPEYLLGGTTGLSEINDNMNMIMRNKLIRSVLVLVLGLAPDFHAAAETIYSTFGPGNDFDRTRYMPVNFYTSPEIIGTSLAFAFDVPGTADYQLTGVSIAASWDGTKMNALLALFSTTASLPSADPLEVIASNPDLLQPISPSVTWLSSASHPTLSAGQRYWLVCQPVSLDASVPANDFFELWMNSQGYEGLQTSRTSYDSAPWGDWFAPAFAGQVPAFSVEATVVPEPTSSALLAAAAALCLSLHCSRRLSRRPAPSLRACGPNHLPDEITGANACGRRQL